VLADHGVLQAVLVSIFCVTCSLLMLLADMSCSRALPYNARSDHLDSVKCRQDMDVS